jgi:glutamine synthetase
LPNVKTTPLALDAFVTEKAKTLFEENDIYNHLELEARHEIMLEEYVKRVQIEARVMGDLASTLIIPAALKYQNDLLKNISGLKEAGLSEDAYASQKEIVTQISGHIAKISEYVAKMIEARKKANDLTDTKARAVAYCDDVKSNYFDLLRYSVDKLELMIDDAYWGLPKYRELLFLR